MNFVPNSVVEKAILFWGKKAQRIMVLEEMNELAVEVCHLIRGRDVNLDNLSEEIADVYLMLDQLIHMERIRSKVEYWKNTKLMRLKEKLDTIERTSKSFGVSIK